MKLKEYLSNPPLLSKPVDDENLHLYLAVSDCVVNAALIREDSGEKELVYYMSNALLKPETRYQKMEKLILALVTVARKFRLYFRLFQVMYMTKYPL